MSQVSELDKRTLTIEKRFDAPLNLVWAAWTEAEHIKNWWGPRGMPVQINQHDFRVGGAWEYEMTMPNGQPFISEGVFSLIVEMDKVFTSANFRPMTEGVEMRSYFKESNGKTHLTFQVVHPTEEYCKQQEEMGFYNGWGTVFGQLDAYVQAQIT